jgi:hypothetical protein
MPGSTERPAAEYEVKAAFLYNFAKFVAWPAGSGGNEFVITILGEDPFGSALDEALAGKEVERRRVVVHRASRLEDLGRTQILFISDSERSRLPVVLKQVEGLGVLTVGEMDRFAEQGGVIHFRTEDRRVRLVVNTAAAERAGLRISSELLKLARIVGPPLAGS